MNVNVIVSERVVLMEQMNLKEKEFKRKMRELSFFELQKHETTKKKNEIQIKNQRKFMTICQQ